MVAYLATVATIGAAASVIRSVIAVKEYRRRRMQ